MSFPNVSEFDQSQWRSARLARDRRFDGHFFVAVKTTGIFCRPICPATAPKEENVEYFHSQSQALKSGYRPCLRCRPEAAPGSCAWLGVETTLQRAIKLIDEGELQNNSLQNLAERLGISDRYLRKLFIQHLGMPPKQYAQHQQLMFAKQLLHNSAMSIGDIAIASGFNSVRRFNDAFLKILQLTPSMVRKGNTNSLKRCQLSLAFRPPFNWQHLLDFYRFRAVKGVEKVGDIDYQRTFILENATGWFKASVVGHNALLIEYEISDIKFLRQMVKQIRRLFDLDADITHIESHLAESKIPLCKHQGIRIPGVWNTWEAGMRAIFGQQISVKAAIAQLNGFVERLGKRQGELVFFPTAKTVADSDLSFLKMPQSRKETIARFAKYMCENFQVHPDEWHAIKGIGPWTINYAKIRGLSEPDCFLATDLVVKKALAEIPEFDLESISPWGSYATFHCWSSQS